MPIVGRLDLPSRNSCIAAMDAIEDISAVEFVPRVGQDSWVNFKVALLPLTLIFALSQAPMMTKHMIEDEPKAPQ